MNHVHRPVPTAGIMIGIAVLLVIGLPGLVFRPSVGAAVGFTLTALMAAGLLALWRLRVECAFDPASGTLRLVSVRWPLPPVEQVLARSSIERVDVRCYRNASRVVLVLRDGAEVPLPGGASGSGAHARTAEVLRGWLTA